MLSPFDDTGAQYAFDSTSLGWAETCLRYYKYSMIDGWRSAHGTVHLEFGALYASALEHFHKHLAQGVEREQALRAVVQEALEATWDSDNDRPKEWDHASKTRANLLRTIVWYVDHFDPDPLVTVILPDGRAAVEYSFRLELDDDILYCGHIDRLVEYNGTTYVQDQKTTQHTLTPSYFEQYSPDTQMSGYAYAARVFYSAPVKGVIIDAAQVAVGFSRFERGFTFRTDKQLEEWREHSLYHIQAARMAAQLDYWPMNRKSCNQYGGCAFRLVCSRSPEVREQFLKADFVKREPWNPLEPR